VKKSVSWTTEPQQRSRHRRKLNERERLDGLAQSAAWYVPDLTARAIHPNKPEYPVLFYLHANITPMDYNWLIVFVAALVPLLMGFIWYHPKTFGTQWMKLNHFTEAELQKGNMALIFGLTYLLSLFLSVGLSGIVIHQSSIESLFTFREGDTEAAKQAMTALAETIRADYSDRYRSFGHGALHGGLAAIMIALPILGINALFERKSWKYIAIHTGYWWVTLLLMGGILCQFL
jgi:hypothetical protein